MLPASTIDKNLFENININKTNISKHQICARVRFKFQNDCVINCGRIVLFPLSDLSSLHCQFNLLYTAQVISDYIIGAAGTCSRKLARRRKLAPIIEAPSINFGFLSKKSGQDRRTSGSRNRSKTSCDQSEVKI